MVTFEPEGGFSNGEATWRTTGRRAKERTRSVDGDADGDPGEEKDGDLPASGHSRSTAYGGRGLLLGRGL